MHQSILIIITFLTFGCTANQKLSNPIDDDSATTDTEPFTCTYFDNPMHGDDGTVEITVETIASGLATPWSIDWLPNGDILVSERDGTISIVSSGVVSPIGNVSSFENSEGGLLGLAIDPNFTSNRYFYLYYTTPQNGQLVNRVSRWELSASSDSISEVQVLIDGMAAQQFHNGGRLRIGPDDKLYIGTGDAGIPDSSQDIDNLSGKILRVNLDGSIPTDNPFPGNPVFVSGIRNTQGFDWREDGKIIVTDHGPSGIPNEGGRADHDEVTLASAGANLGWPDVYACEEAEGFTTASITWSKAMPPGGAAIYTGTEIPEWQGDLFIGVLGFDDDTPHLHRLRLSNNGNIEINEVYLRSEYGRLREVAMGPDGGLYVTTSNCDGRGDCGDGDKILRVGTR